MPPKITIPRGSSARRLAHRIILPVLLAGASGGCVARASTGELFPELVAHAGERVSDVRFRNAAPFSADTLLTVVQTQPSRCSFLGIPICVPLTQIGRQEHHVSPERIRQDLAALARFYRAAGYFGTRVTPALDARNGNAVVTFVIERGDPILVDRLDVSGTEGVVDADSLEARLPLRPGAIFDLGKFAASWDQVQRALTDRGHAYAEVLRNFSVDTIDNVAEVELVAIPGPRVVVDSIAILGAEHLGRNAALRQLTFRKGDVLLQSRLAESQRNLYELELVQLAAVGVGADSAQATPRDSSRATVVVQIAEAPVHQVDAAIGFGTVECLRLETEWLSRSFGGGARRLALGGSVSKIGTGEPFRIGSGDRLCSGAGSDTITNKYDYRLSADLTQPYFLSPRNRLALNAYAERLSEARLYQREAVGARLGLTRRVGARSAAGLALESERGSTQASPALFCAAFLFCEPEIADSLARTRLRNQVSLNWTHDHTDALINPTRGFTIRTAATWAAPWLASEVQFVRWTGEAAAYRPIRQGWVAAASLRLGNFFQTATLVPGRNFLPPEERFYAGGASSVRGFDRNTLGPGIWVRDEAKVEGTDTITPSPRFIPTGGTAVAVASAELRFPSPVLSRVLRLAAFVDAGTVTSGSLWEISPKEWKWTPGAGLRLATPVGPVRIDVAVNPYGLPAGPLLVTDPVSGTIRRVGEHEPGTPNFFQRLHIHFAVGQAF